MRSSVESTAQGDVRPKNVDDLVAFGMRLVFAPAPAYHRLLYCDGGRDGVVQAYALLVEFLQYLCDTSHHSKRLTTLQVRVHNATTYADDFLRDFEKNSKLTLVRSGEDLTPPHPASLRGPDSRGVATLVLQYFPDTEDDPQPTLPLDWFAAECSTRSSQPNAQALRGTLVPQYTGSWFEARRILESHGFEPIDASGQKWFEAAQLSPDDNPTTWVEPVLKDLQQLPLLVCVPDGFIAWKDVLNKPRILVEQ